VTGNFKFHLDENVPPQIAPALRAVWRRHEFTTAVREHLLGTRDLELIPTLAERKHHAIVTFDRNQLGDGVDTQERDALVAAGLHWIGIPTAPEGMRGPRVVARATAIVVAGLPFVLADWRPEPHAYHLHEPRVIDRMKPTIEKLQGADTA
jgi:hypothetical protein